MKYRYILIIPFIFLILILPNRLGQSDGYEIDNNEIESISLFEERYIEEELEIKKSVKNENSSGSVSGWWSYPDDIKECTRDGNDLLVLVNKEYRLPSTYAPKDLVSASGSGIVSGNSYYLRSIVINDLKNLVNDAKSDGITLTIVSGYRSYSTQLSTYNSWLKKNNYDVDYVDTFSARAGHSQHQLGTAIDFSSTEVWGDNWSLFEKTKASDWLAKNAYRYGFVISFPKGYESVTGYKYESWHYRYIGKSNALEMVNSGMILERYLESKN